MKPKLIFILFIMSLGNQVYAKKNCTSAPKEKWLTESNFKDLIEKQGYKIRKFKQPGTCYEIYGQNPKGQNVEIYFNPVNAEIIKSEIDD